MNVHLLVTVFIGCRFAFAGQCEETNIKLCENGGTCVNIDSNDYECICLNGYSGKNCSYNEDDCMDNLCATGSTCIDGIAKYTCACPPGKIGLFCHLDDPCLQKPCRSGAECVVDTASGEFSCNCMKGTTGQDCTTDINECEENDKLCFNGGICVNTFGSWYCDCPPGYSDLYCMIHDSKCEPNPCFNGASCLDYGQRYECICQNGFYGKDCELSCPPGFEGRACKQHRISLDNNHVEELFEEQICTLHNCSSKAGNNMCDSECNYPACNYDGFDCSAHVQPFQNCQNPNFCARVFQDNKCDPICNRSECLFDGFDCDKKAETCMYEDFCSIRFNDGYCDSECFSEECYFDGFDCSQPSQPDTLKGNLILIILMPLDGFLKRAHVLQYILSKGMRTRVTIAIDENKQKKLYSWEAETEEGHHLHGTKVYFNIERMQCQEDSCEHSITDMEQAANFVGAISTKQLLRPVGAAIHAAEAELESDAKYWTDRSVYVFMILALQICTALIVLAQKNFKSCSRRLQKRVHVAGTWFPPTRANCFPLNLLNGFSKSNETVQGSETQNIQGESTLNKTVTEQEQKRHYTEVCVITEGDKNIGEENTRERYWTTLHDQAMNRSTISIPIDKTLVDIKTKEGRTALMLTALNQGKTESNSCTDLENLCLAGATINEQDDCGETALIMAIKAGRAEVVKCLLRWKADAAIADDHGRTTLHHAVAINAADILRILLEVENVEVDAIDDTDCSPLMTVAKLGYRDPETSALLINAGANINCVGNHVNGEMYKGRTALHYAVMQSNHELATYLVERGANLNIQDHAGQTPLFLAASQGHVEMVHLLVTAGARQRIPDNMDQTPEQIASYNEYREVVEYFASLRFRNDSTMRGGKSRRSEGIKGKIKKPRIIEIPTEPIEMVSNLDNVAGTSGNSNSNLSDAFDRSRQNYHPNTSIPYETASIQVLTSPRTVLRQDLQHPEQVQYPYPRQTANHWYTMGTDTSIMNNGEYMPSHPMPTVEMEHYV